MICDNDRRWSYVSPKAARIFGFGADGDSPPTRWTPDASFFRPDMVTPYPQQELPLTRALHGEEALHELVFIRSATRPAGLWFDISAIPVWDDEGGLAGGAMVFSDVRVPESLFRSQAAVEAFLTPRLESKGGRMLNPERRARFQSMFDQLARAVDQVGDSIFITDHRGIIEYVNPAFERVTGYSAAEVLGRKPDLLKSGKHDASFYRDLWDDLNHGGTFQGTVINRRKNGESFWSEQTISAVKDQAGSTTSFVSVLKDLTAFRKKQERDIQMSLAREVQQRYYSMTASLPGFDIGSAVHPADETGGDYFDFIPQEDGSLLVVVADVSGHGFGSALVMAEVRASVRAYAATAPDIPSILSRMNRSLAGTQRGERFVTMFLGRIDTGGSYLEYASAGHEPGCVLNQTGAVVAMLDSTEPPLGWFPAQTFGPARRIPLAPGDTVLLLTDGVTDAGNQKGPALGFAGAVAFMQQHHGGAEELARGLCAMARSLSGTGPQEDDIMSVVCKVD